MPMHPIRNVSMFAPGVTFMDMDFHNTDATISAFTVSIFVMGFAVGPLFLSPLSEIHGRRPVLGCANAFFCVWQIGCALAPNISTLIVFRFFAGIGGSGCLTIGGGQICFAVISGARRPLSIAQGPSSALLLARFAGVSLQSELGGDVSLSPENASPALVRSWVDRVLCRRLSRPCTDLTNISNVFRGILGPPNRRLNNGNRRRDSQPRN